MRGRVTRQSVSSSARYTVTLSRSQRDLDIARKKTGNAQADSPDPVRRGVVRGRAKQQIISTVGDTAYRLQRCRICVQRTRTQHPLYRPRGGAHLSRDTTSDACVVRRVPGVRCGARAERAPRLRAGAWAARGPGRSRRQKGNNRKTATSRTFNDSYLSSIYTRLARDPTTEERSELAPCNRKPSEAQVPFTIVLGSRGGAFASSPHL